MIKLNTLTVRIRPTKKQKICWNYLDDKETEFIFFGGGAGGGKSWLGCEWLLKMCLVYPGSRWFIGRNELTRLKKSTYITWLKVCAFHKIPNDLWKFNSQDNIIEFINFKTRQFDNYGSKIDLINVEWQPRDPLYERFGSIEYTGGFGEEVGEWKEKAFDVLKSRIGRHNDFDGVFVFPKFYLTGNPKKNWSYYSFYKPWKDTHLADGHTFIMQVETEKFTCVFIQSLYYDNPYTVKQYERQLQSIRDKVLRERLKNGNWEYEDNEASLIEYEKILTMFSRIMTEEMNGEMYLSVDAARFGGDLIVVILWQGLFIKKIYPIDKSDLYYATDIAEKNKLKDKYRLTKTAEKIRVIMSKYHIDISHVVIDEDGVGGGLVDILYGSVGFVNGSKAIHELNDNDYMQETDKYFYKNLRSQCYFKLSELINDGKIGIYTDIPMDVQQSLIEELEVVRKKYVEDNEKKLQIIGKEDIKEIIGRSPDFADSMMMRMYYELGMESFTDIAVVW